MEAISWMDKITNSKVLERVKEKSLVISTAEITTYMQWRIDRFAASRLLSFCHPTNLQLNISLLFSNPRLITLPVLPVFVHHTAPSF